MAMTPPQRKAPEPPYYDKCGNCGTKRADPLADTCPSCGEPYVLSNMPTGQPSQDLCRYCRQPIYWITMRSGKKQPVNTRLVQIVTTQGDVARGYVSHYATCTSNR